MRCAKLAGVLFAAIGLALVFFASPAQADTLSDQQQFVADVNQLRASKGLGQVTVDANLTDIALGWSQKMAAAGDISHNPRLADLVTSNWNKLGENVGVGPSVQQLFTAFVNSPHHYANLVDPSFTHIGVGVVYSGSTIYTSHEFMQLRGGGASKPAPAPTQSTVATTPRTTRVPATTASTVLSTTTTRPVPPTTPPPPPVPEAWLRVLYELLERFDPSHLPSGG